MTGFRTPNLAPPSDLLEQHREHAQPAEGQFRVATGVGLCEYIESEAECLAKRDNAQRG